MNKKGGKVKMKKNIVSVITSLALVFSLAGCSVTVNGPAGGQPEGEKTQTDAPDQEASENF